MPPWIPFEVAENIIDALEDDVKTLQSCSLTCGGWLPRSRLHLFRTVQVGLKRNFHALEILLAAKPHLRFLIHALTVSPRTYGAYRTPLTLVEVVPVRVLSKLPNLRSWKIRDPNFARYVSVSFSLATLRSMWRYSPIRELHVHDLRFATYVELSRFLTAFPKLRRISCSWVSLDELPERRGGLRLPIKRISPRQDVTTLEILGIKNELVISSLLELFHLTIRELSLKISLPKLNEPTLPGLPHFPHLRSLTLSIDADLLHQVDGFAHAVELITRLVESTPLAVLQELKIVMEYWGSHPLRKYLTEEHTVIEEFRRLEQLLLSRKSLNLTVLLFVKRNKFPPWIDVISRVFPILDGQKRLRVESSARSFGHDDEVTCLVVSPNNRLLASGSRDHTALIWSVDSGAIIHELVCVDEVLCLAFSPDSEHLATGNKMGFTVWDVLQGYQLWSSTGYCVVSIHWSPTSTTLVAMSYNNTAHVWDMQTQQQLYRIPRVRGCPGSAISPDGQWLAACDAWYRCCIWEVATGRLHRTLHRGDTSVVTVPVRSVAFDPMSNRLAAACDDSRVHVWDIHTGEEVADLKGHTDIVVTVAFSPDGQRIFSGSEDMSVRVWELPSRRPLWLCTHIYGIQDKLEDYYCGSFSPDTKYVMSLPDYQRQTLDLFRTSDFKRVERIYHDELITRAVISPDGETLAIATCRGSIRILQLGHYTALRDV